MTRLESRLRIAGLGLVSDPKGTTIDPCHNCDARPRAICGDLSVEQIDRLETLVSKVSLSPGEVLCHEGDPINSELTITKGALKRYALLPDGRRQVIGFYFRGDFVPAPPDGISRVTVEALTPVSVCRFPKRAFDALVEEWSTLRHTVRKRLTDELEETEERILLLGRKTAVERIASFLFEIDNRAVDFRMGDGALVLPMSRQDIADYLGLTTETVSRSFTKLRKAGLIETGGDGRVVLKNRECLQDVADCLDDLG